MEARIGELLQHEIGNVRTVHAQCTGRKRVGKDTIPSGKGPSMRRGARTMV